MARAISIRMMTTMSISLEGNWHLYLMMMVIITNSNNNNFNKKQRLFGDRRPQLLSFSEEGWWFLINISPHISSYIFEKILAIEFLLTYCNKKSNVTLEMMQLKFWRIIQKIQWWSSCRCGKRSKFMVVYGSHPLLICCCCCYYSMKWDCNGSTRYLVPTCPHKK